MEGDAKRRIEEELKKRKTVREKLEFLRELAITENDAPPIDKKKE